MRPGWNWWAGEHVGKDLRQNAIACTWAFALLPLTSYRNDLDPFKGPRTGTETLSQTDRQNRLNVCPPWVTLLPLCFFVRKLDSIWQSQNCTYSGPEKVSQLDKVLQCQQLGKLLVGTVHLLPFMLGQPLASWLALLKRVPFVLVIWSHTVVTLSGSNWQCCYIVQ